MSARRPEATVMGTEMAEQPSVLRGLVARRSRIEADVRAVLPAPLAGVALVARGSSQHAATFGRYVLEVSARKPVTIVAPSVWSVYRAEVDYRGFLALGLSQSGSTPDVVEALAHLGRRGAATVALTARPSSPLARVADLALDLGTGEERAVPATKTVTAELALLAMVAGAAGEPPWEPEDWARVPDAVAEVLADDAAPVRAAERLAGADRVACVGRGFLAAVADEAALKLQETALMAATGYSAAAFRHGPIAATGPSYPVVAFAAPGPAGDDVRRLGDRPHGAVGGSCSRPPTPAPTCPSPPACPTPCSPCRPPPGPSSSPSGSPSSGASTPTTHPGCTR